MLIKQKRIRTIDRYLSLLPKNAITVGVVNPDQAKLQQIGFELPISNGATILPAALGSISEYNAEGKEIVERDKPMETAYRSAEWIWTEWHGRDQVERSKIVSVPYQRYPRSFIAPPAVELSIATDASGSQIVIAPTITNPESQKELLIHTVNLFLELFGECNFFDETLNQLMKAPLKRLNWRILPPGKMPWKKLEEEIKDVISRAGSGKRVVIEHRLKTINDYNPEFSAVGHGGFSGYIVLGFPKYNLFILESMFYGNATYVFGEKWEELSKKTKAEILNQELQQKRIVHNDGWEPEIYQLLSKVSQQTEKQLS